VRHLHTPFLFVGAIFVLSNENCISVNKTKYRIQSPHAYCAGCGTHAQIIVNNILCWNRGRNENVAKVHVVCEILIDFHISASVEIVKFSQLYQDDLWNKGRRHVTRMEDILNVDIYKIMVGKLYGNRPLERPGGTMERKC
jgi:hypothetical protein